jgi:hypothetical protein
LHLLIRIDCDCFPIISAYHVNRINGGQKDGNANFYSLVFGGNSAISIIGKIRENSASLKGEN